MCLFIRHSFSVLKRFMRNLHDELSIMPRDCSFLARLPMWSLLRRLLCMMRVVCCSHKTQKALTTSSTKQSTQKPPPPCYATWNTPSAAAVRLNPPIGWRVISILALLVALSRFSVVLAVPARLLLESHGWVVSL